MYLYELLGLTPPKFYHVPLLLSPDGRRLSKRDGDLSVDALLSRSTPGELVGKFAYLAGLNPSAKPQAPESLLAEFDWERVSKKNIFASTGLFF